MLKGMFTLHIPPDDNGFFEIHTKACNDLRRELYTRARGNGLAATACRRLLAYVECQRWEKGRPTDEPRHPATGDNGAWTDALVIAG